MSNHFEVESTNWQPTETEIASLRAAQDVELDTQVKKRAEQLTELDAQWRREAIALIGPDKWKDYQKVQQEKKAGLRDLQQPDTYTTETIRELETQLGRVHAKARKDMKAVGFSEKKLEGLHRRFVEKGVQTARSWFWTDANFEIGPQSSLAMTPPEEMLKPGWTELKAPYPSIGANKGWKWSSTGIPQAETWMDERTGEAFRRSLIFMFNTDDSDRAWTETHGDFLFFYQMPAPGLIQLVVTLRSVGGAFCHGKTWDEWGTSGCSINASSHVYLAVRFPPSDVPPSDDPILGRNSIYAYDRSTIDDHWRWNMFPLGDVRFMTVFSKHPFAKGTNLFCSVGIIDRHDAWVNDVGVWMEHTSKWIIESVRIRATGA